MPRDEDDDGSLPPLGSDTQKFLEQAKKGQPRNFLLVCKGNKVNYLTVRKKPIKKNEISEARKAGYKGDGYFGVINGKGMELVFNLAQADGYSNVVEAVDSNPFGVVVTVESTFSDAFDSMEKALSSM